MDLTQLLIKPNIATTALCVIPPDYMHDYVDDFRKQYDKAWERWPPHINLVFPFLDKKNFETIKNSLKIEFVSNNIVPFVIKLDTIDYFEQGNNITVHAKPRKCPELAQIYKIICDTLKIEPNHTAFVPHMTLGQIPKTDISKVTEIKNSWGSGLNFTIDSLQLISRDGNTRFQTIDNITFR